MKVLRVLCIICALVAACARSRSARPRIGVGGFAIGVPGGRRRRAGRDPVANAQARAVGALDARPAHRPEADRPDAGPHAERRTCSAGSGVARSVA